MLIWPFVRLRLRGRTGTLPIVQLDKSVITTPRERVSRKYNLRTYRCSYGKVEEDLQFTAWNLFHAAKKTEFVCSFTAGRVNSAALAFGIEHHNTFIWNTRNFRIVDRGVFRLADFASSCLAGRVGEATAYLTMVKWGYKYWDRCEVVWERAARGVQITHQDSLRVAAHIAGATRRGDPAPDFIMEKSNRDVALMEAKGGFVSAQPGRAPQVKQDMRDALAQLRAWSGVIQPSPTASYGIGTYIREEHDTSGDPSVITFVDPPGEADTELPSVRLRADLVRRCNYGAWLVGMGLFESGMALRDLRAKPLEKTVLSVAEIDGVRFGVIPIGWVVGPKPRMGRFHLPSWFLALGVHVEVLRSLAEAIHDPDSQVLMELDSRVEVDMARFRELETGSVMPDGSFVGTVHRDQLKAEVFLL